MILANFISLLLVIVGGLNWGLIGLFNFNLVETIFNGYNIGSQIIYVLVCLAAIWLIVSFFVNKFTLKFIK